MTEILNEDDFDAIYEGFIDDAIHTGCVWGLSSEEGWALCPSSYSDSVDVMPLWSQPELAKVHCQDEWANYEVVPISLEELLDEWLPGMHQDILLVGIDWNADLDGEEIEPLDLLEDFDKAAAEH
ncbi:DUF2750 domain-containing protein [Agarilytica rhodophyticola]|uniref:DUF2750 domain-containing protein n=1 Tax=Agarilytica rhodophyticola TaxID=1737490 RepID=UPI000B342D0C|nr:DUF2750 domain-containing protein [Agarilytica rhodophyticola]